MPCSPEDLRHRVLELQPLLHRVRNEIQCRVTLLHDGLHAETDACETLWMRENIEFLISDGVEYPIGNLCGWQTRCDELAVGVEPCLLDLQLGSVRRTEPRRTVAF